jgi:hypothetical protein
MPASPKPKDRLRTRAGNASKHPGEVQLATKRKKRTRAEIERDEALKQVAKEEKIRKKEETIQRIAALEEKIADEDAIADLQVGANWRPIRNSRKIVAAMDESEDEPYLDGGSSSVYQPSCEPPSTAEEFAEEEVVVDDVEKVFESEAEPPKKKAKTVKVPVRQAISSWNARPKPVGDEVENVSSPDRLNVNTDANEFSVNGELGDIKREGRASPRIRMAG